MRPMKKLPLLSLIVLLALTACAQQVEVAPSASPPPTRTLAPEPTSAPPTVTLAPPTPTLAPTAETNVSAGPDSLFAPVTDDEWQIGLKTAAVTIVEYGDFQ